MTFLTGFILVLTGIIFGIFSGIIALYIKCHVGNLQVDRSDPEDGPYLFLELEKDVNQVSSKKCVILVVKNENYISRR